MKRPSGPVLAAIVSALIVVIAVVALLLPRFSATSERRERLREAQQQEESLLAQLAELQAARKQAKALLRDLARLEARVPPTADQPSLLRLLDGAANRASVDLISVAPGTPVSGGAPGVSTIPLQINITGSFFEVEEFMFRLETLPRSVRVTQIAVSEGPDGLPQLNVTAGAEVYTTDASAGPGSVPGPTEQLPPSPGATPGPTPTATEAA